MQLTLYTDYALRVLIYLGIHDNRLCSIGEIARSYRISQNHLMKIVHDLGKEGVVKTVRGRNGGLRLGLPPGEITIGRVVRHTEDMLSIVGCDTCLLAPACTLAGAVGLALSAFLKVLDGFTLEDVIKNRQDLERLFVNASLANEGPQVQAASHIGKYHAPVR